MAKKTWQQKFLTPLEPETQSIDKPYAGLPAGSIMLISTPREIWDQVKNIPFGSSMSVQELRAGLAQSHGADFTCPLTTGIFLRIASEVSWDQIESGIEQSQVMPFWRVIRAKDPIAKKLRCGSEFIAAKREEEGI